MFENPEAVLLFLAILRTAVCGDCPPPESIHPCSCLETHSGGMLDCWNMYTPDELVYPIAATAGYRMFSVAVMNSSLMYIPHDLFKGTTYENIYLMNTAVISLTDTDDAFEGLESTLEEFRATDAQYTAQWDWEHFRKLKKLELIDVNWVQVYALQEDIPHLPKLNAIGITNAGITEISDTVFANLPNLRIWDMRNNKISELKRSMLPSPAKRLTSINLENNKLQNLPEDFFEDMPSLEFLNLQNNQFVSLSEKVFGTVFWKLQEIFFEGNPFRCDCRMSWLFGKKSSYYFKAECQQPESLKGRKLVELSSKELHCPRF